MAGGTKFFLVLLGLLFVPVATRRVQVDDVADGEDELLAWDASDFDEELGSDVDRGSNPEKQSVKDLIAKFNGQQAVAEEQEEVMEETPRGQGSAVKATIEKLYGKKVSKEPEVEAEETPRGQGSAVKATIEKLYGKKAVSKEPEVEAEETARTKGAKVAKAIERFSHNEAPAKLPLDGAANKTHKRRGPEKDLVINGLTFLRLQKGFQNTETNLEFIRGICKELQEEHKSRVERDLPTNTEPAFNPDDMDIMTASQGKPVGLFLNFKDPKYSTFDRLKDAIREWYLVTK